MLKEGGWQMIETQKTISEWGTKTFGYPKSRDVIVNRMLKECEELKDVTFGQDYAGTYNTEYIAEECADIYIVMCQVMTIIGYDLHVCVDRKMEINRARKWEIAGDGTGRHI